MHAILTLLAAAPAPVHHGNPFVHLLLSYGIIGLFLVSIVDSSFIPLPLPGVTDIMLVFFAASHANPFLLVVAATAGSALGGWFSYRVGQSGGMAFIEKRTPPRIFKAVTSWMEAHAILAVALPAILPPPAPLSPFVLAAGALKMRLRTFMIAFTASRCHRHPHHPLVLHPHLSRRRLLPTLEDQSLGRRKWQPQNKGDSVLTPDGRARD